MAEYRAVKRMLLITAAMLGCVCAFAAVLSGVGAVLLRTDEQTVFTLSVEQSEPEALSLPCRVEGTALIARRLVVYEGPYLENGSDTPVSDITALVLYNSGDQEISQAEVVLTGEEELTFFASNIMPGAQVLVLEGSAAAWKERQITACRGWVSEESTKPLPEEDLQLQDADIGTISVTNRSAGKLTNIWLFYKNYLADGDLYVGGITYIATIDSLEPGQTVQIQPDHYASGYSRVLKAVAVP